MVERKQTTSGRERGTTILAKQCVDMEGEMGRKEGRAEKRGENKSGIPY